VVTLAIYPSLKHLAEATAVALQPTVLTEALRSSKLNFSIQLLSRKQRSAGGFVFTHTASEHRYL
jgi:hypothetical protein